MITIDDIDIYILTHNRSVFLGESILSLLNQSARPQSITVLDNESTDDTPDVVERYRSHGVQYVRTGGFLGNFNAAREIVKTRRKKYCMLFHDDDLLHPDYLKLVLKILRKYHDVSLVTCSYTEFFDNEVPSMSVEPKFTWRYFRKASPLWAKYMYFFEFVAYAPAVYRVVDFLANDLEYEKYSKFNDWPFLAKMARTGDVVFLTDRNNFFVRRHSDQDTWTGTNTPSIRQIINWDLFYLHEMKMTKGEDLHIWKGYVKYFLSGKYNAFLSDEDRARFSYEDVVSAMIKMDSLLCDSKLEEYLGDLPDVSKYKDAIRRATRAPFWHRVLK